MPLLQSDFKGIGSNPLSGQELAGTLPRW